jgi:hypothetical protein
VSEDAGAGLEFDAPSFDDASAEMGLASSHLDGAAADSVSVQGEAGAQLRQWLPTAPAADAVDRVEGVADGALSQATAITREDAGKLLTQQENMLGTEARNTALINEIRGDPELPPAGTDESPGLASGALGGADGDGAAGTGDAANANAEVDAALDRVNPKFDPSQSAYRENCTGVTQAYELQRRGIGAEAGPLEKPLWSSEGGPGGRPLGSIENTWGGKFTAGTKADIQQAFDEPGSRGIVYIAWKNGGGHVFNVENVDGTVRFLDGQPTPSVQDASGYFDLGGNTHYLRLDDLPTPPDSSTKPYLEP